VLLVVVGVEVRELDGVLDGLDLVAEAADIVVADVGTSSRVRSSTSLLGSFSRR